MSGTLKKIIILLFPDIIFGNYFFEDIINAYGILNLHQDSKNNLIIQLSSELNYGNIKNISRNYIIKINDDDIESTDYYSVSIIDLKTFNGNYYSREHEDNLGKRN